MSELNPKALKYDLAPKINGKLIEHAAAIRALGKKTVENIVEIGRRLTECRSILKEDNSWRVWLDGELRLSPQTAGRFIQVHELSQTRSNLEHLDLPVSAIYLLAAPSTPEAAKTEIIERAKAGEALPVAKVKRVVDNHKKTKARQQPAKKAKKRAKKIDRQVEEVPAPSPEIIQQRDAAAARIRALMGREPEPRDDIGPASFAETERLRARNEELEHAQRRLETENAALRSEVEETKSALQNKTATDTRSRIADRPGDTPEKCWQRSLTNTADDIIALPTYWTCAFGDWRKFAVPADLLALAVQVSTAWTDIVKVLSAPKPSSAPASVDDGLDIPASLQRSPQ